MRSVAVYVLWFEQRIEDHPRVSLNLCESSLDGEKHEPVPRDGKPFSHAIEAIT
jgi:hypothetical protein